MIHSPQANLTFYKSIPAAFCTQKQYGDEASLVALFTFVARDPLSQRAVTINPLRPSSEADRALFAERQRVADERRAARRAASQGASTPSARPMVLRVDDVCTCNGALLLRRCVMCGGCACGQPVAHALTYMLLCALLHPHHLQHSGASMVFAGFPGRAQTLSVIVKFSVALAPGTEEAAARRWADSQLAEARTMVDLPALAPPDAILMGATAMQNTFTCQPQVPPCGTGLACWIRVLGFFVFHARL